jgi:hypothetical protein
MATVLITNLAPIDDAARELFASLFAACEEAGHACAFWSCIPVPSQAAFALPMHWDIGRWEALFAPERLAPYRREPPLVDKAVWLARVERLCKQSVPHGRREPLLETLYAASRAVCDAVRPDLLLAWNPLCPHTGVLAALCRARGVPVMLLERGPLPATWYLEAGGLLGHGTLADVPLDALLAGLDRDALARRGREALAGFRFDAFTLYPQQEEAAFWDRLAASSRQGPKIAFFPPDDTSLGFTPQDHPDRLASLPGFPSSFAAARALARANAGGLTLFKRHPSFRDETFPEDDPSGLVVTEEDFRRCIAWADIVATTGSGLQLVALAAGKPVISMGRDYLGNKGVVFEAREESAIGPALDAVVREGMTPARQERFQALLGYLLRHAFLGSHAPGDREPRAAMRALCAALWPEAARDGGERREALAVARRALLTDAGRAAALLPG